MADTSGEWREERLWVLRELERLNTSLERKTYEIAQHEEREERERRDIHQAHHKIRMLETSKESLNVRVWIASCTAAFLGAALIELVAKLWK
jgi:hypothetical protein